MKTQHPTPPRLADRLLEYLLDPELLEELQGDLHEQYEIRMQEMHPLAAKLSYYWGVLQFVQPAFLKKRHAINIHNPSPMYKNYFKVACRQILKHKTFSAINIFGLAMSMSIAMLIMLIYTNQAKYDSFHTHKERIYRVLTDDGNYPNYATTPFPLAEELRQYTEVEDVVRLGGGYGGDAEYEQKVVTVYGMYADENFFTFFDFEFKEGNPYTALNKPFSIVINEESARKLFGNESAVGKVINFKERGLDRFGFNFFSNHSEDFGEYTVTGVLADNEQRSHIPTTSFVSMSTWEKLLEQELVKSKPADWKQFYETFTYLLLREESNASAMEEVLAEIHQRQYKDMEARFQDDSFALQALTDITPGKLLNNLISFRLPLEIYFFLMALAEVVVLTACFNYTNLSVARSLSRAKEVSIRKVSGANKKHLYMQFLSESVLVALLAMVLAVLMLNLIKPAFAGLWFNKYLNIQLDESLEIYTYFGIFALLVGIMAGIFPALYTARFSPMQVLRNLSPGRAGKLTLRKILIITQFSFSIIFILSTLLVYRQMTHFLQLEYGFQKENIINIHLQGNAYEQAVNKIRAVPGVSRVSGSQYIISSGINFGSDLLPADAADDDEPFLFSYINVSDGYAENLELPLLAGEYLHENSRKGDVLMNRAAMEKLEINAPEELVGRYFRKTKKQEDTLSTAMYHVVGVVEDFQYDLPMEESGPIYIEYNPERLAYMNVKINTENVAETLAGLEASWKEIDPVHSFEYDFFDEQLSGTLQFFWDIIAIIGYFSALAIVISCLGLLGMATYTAESRKKEVGIRKVLGADINSLIILLSRGFMYMLGIAICIATPLAYLANNLWLQKFANRVSFSADIVLISVGIVLLLGILTIGSQTWRAARSNPVKTLRAE
jgi:putative ABC transport system permease protein